LLYKLVTPDAFDFPDEPVRLLKLSSRGLIGNDRRQFEKQACTDFLRDIDKLVKQAQPGEEWLHLIAMGATEHTGPNRNGDGWKADTLRRMHDTFVKHARWYRNHQNTDPAKSYGVVKYSAFNERNPRVELIVALNATEAAARRHGGLVADRELTKLANQQPISVSMACSLPFDVCSYCGNEARSPSQYCLGTDEGGSCRAGGLRHKMGSVVTVDGDLHHLHADNPANGLRFFDISDVFRPADRIAYVVSHLTKSAAASRRTISGAELAQQAGLYAEALPVLKLAHDSVRTQKLYKLFEAAVAAEPVVEKWAATQTAGLQMLGVASQDADLCFKLAQHAIAFPARFETVVLPFSSFLHAYGNIPIDHAMKVAAAAQLYLPSIYGQLHSTGEASRYLSTVFDTVPTRGWTKLATTAVSSEDLEKFSLDTAAYRRAVIRHSLQSSETDMRKLATSADIASRRRVLSRDNSDLEKLASHYAVYKLDRLARVKSSESVAGGLQLALLSNYLQTL
jgi:hypothetical protein